ncbi:uncharacterized protein LOC126969449 [Leptidea sinapis]|uniref:uncharacterized protein LOC126969449 n=1 Tax=Leptidea sinapis TaxID=189913 RepID=UPI0021C47E59|nr:uncharacterized protein LOC126969449 [Leptidea sinapis]
MFLSLDLYRRPLLIADNEDFVANVNRKEMRRLEAFWLRNRQQELQREANMLQSYMYRLRSLNQQFEQLLDSIWSQKQRPEEYLERSVASTLSLRDALALVSIRLRAAANYAQSSLRSIDEALPAWKLASIGTSGIERTRACADASRLLLRARCFERGARRVLGVQSAPRAARTLRLTLDYIFTDALHDRKYQRATETFIQFKEAMVELVNSINQVFLSNIDNLTVVEKDLAEGQRRLREARVNDILNKGLVKLQYNGPL